MKKVPGQPAAPIYRIFVSMEDSAMKQTCKRNRLPIVTVVLGCCALILRRVLYAVAVDVKICCR